MSNGIRSPAASGKGESPLLLRTHIVVSISSGGARFFC